MRPCRLRSPKCWPGARSSAVSRRRTAPSSERAQVTLAAGQSVDDLDFGTAAVAAAENRAPVFTTLPPSAAEAGRTLLYHASALDPDGDAVRFDLPPPSAKPGMLERFYIAIRTWASRGTLPLYHEFGAVRLVQPQNATITVDVVPAPVELELAGVPIRWRNLQTGLRATIRPVLARVTARGRREALADLRAGSIDASLVSRA